MRLRALLFSLTALVGVGVAAQRLGAAATAYVERATAAEVGAGLSAAGETWATAAADGLIVTLTGAAPDEARRLRAAEILRRIVDPARVRDETTLAASDPLAPPPFALELLRSEAEVSLIGLAPETAGRAAIAEGLARGGLDSTVSDMLESVAHPAPDGWEAALEFSLAALADLPQAKISVMPGQVAITALADSAAEGDALAARLRDQRPEGVALTLEINTPLPAISPFRVEFALAGGTGRLLACAAETEADATAIRAAAAAPAADCPLGIGAPAEDWAAVATAGIAAVRELGGGRFALSDLEATLAPPADATPERIAAARRTLEAALPKAVSLAVATPPPARALGAAAAPAATPAPAPRFDAVLSPDGAVRLTGGVRDATSQAAIESFAAALFGAGRVENATEIAAGLPDGWPGRVLAGVEALALMKEGRVAVTPGQVTLDGWAEDADSEAKAAALFAGKDLGATAIAVRFDAAAAAAEAEVRAAIEDPTGTCAAAITAILAEAPLAFEPGSATLAPSAEPAIAALGAAFAGCPPVDFEIAGHTDSQGAADRNQALSEDRAETIKAALEAADLPQIGFVARGYGAARPIADNATEEGRARNRRIEITLIPPPGFAMATTARPEAPYGPQ